MSEQSVKITFTEHDVTTMHTELAAIRERVHKLIWVRESATSHKYLRLLQKLAAWKRDDGFDRREVTAERRALKHVCLVDDPKHPEIQVQFDPRRPPTPQEFRGKLAKTETPVGQGKQDEAGTLANTAAAAVRFSPATSSARPLQQPCSTSRVRTDMRSGEPVRECSNLNKLVWVLKHPESRVSQAER